MKAKKSKVKKIKVFNTSYDYGSLKRREFQMRQLIPFEGWITRGVFFNFADAQIFLKALKG